MTTDRAVAANQAMAASIMTVAARIRVVHRTLGRRRAAPAARAGLKSTGWIMRTGAFSVLDEACGRLAAIGGGVRFGGPAESCRAARSTAR
jgi:hypothetical protein